MLYNHPIEKGGEYNLEERDIAIRIGQRLRELRGIRTQVGVAKALGISQNALINYEKGRRIPPDSIKRRIATYYERTVESIFYAD